MTTVIIINSCFQDCASALLVLNSDDEESKQTGGGGAFIQTFLYLDVLFTFEFLPLNRQEHFVPKFVHKQ